MGQHGRDGYAAASAPVGADDRRRTPGRVEEQARIPNVSAEAPHSLRSSLPKGGAHCARVEAERCDIVRRRADGIAGVAGANGKGPREGIGPAHPLFGPLTWREWGVATYKHADHHLKQFGA